MDAAIVMFWCWVILSNVFTPGMPTTEKLSNRTQTTAGTLVVTPKSSSTSGTHQSKGSPTSNKPEKNSNAISINSFETRLLNMTFSESLQDPDSHEFKDLKAMLETALTVVFQDMPGFLEAKVTGFRKGSVITMFSVVFNGTSSIASRSFTEVMVRLKNANGTKVLNDLLLGDVTSVISVRSPERRVSKKERDVDEGQSVPQWVLIMIAPVYFTLMVIFMGVHRYRNQKARREKEKLQSVIRPEDLESSPRAEKNLREEQIDNAEMVNELQTNHAALEQNRDTSEPIYGHENMKSP